MNTFKNKVLAGAIKVQNNVYMKAISNAMMGLMPIMMISSIASLIKYRYWQYTTNNGSNRS